MTPKTILCVDDDELVRNALTTLLSSFGYQVVTAESGAAALRLLGSHNVDLAIVDYNMPQMNGLALAREIKQLQPELPILLLTGDNVLPREFQHVDGVFLKGKAAGLLHTIVGLLT
jgi:CheY-like chemotaxis protein